MKKHKRRKGTRSKGHGKNPRQSAPKPPETWEAKRLRQYQQQKAMDNMTAQIGLEVSATLMSLSLRKAKEPDNMKDRVKERFIATKTKIKHNYT